MRNKTIDFLRGIAVLLTLFRHSPYQSIFTGLKQAGWMGVDLFFVLSGFLVSGLIFDEYAKTKAFNWKDFLIRRGFKIYPAFWVLILFTVCFEYWTSGSWDYGYAIRNLLFIQNYFKDCPFNHTWSLCVEEHFYFFLVLFFVLIFRFARNVPKAIFTGAVIIILYGITAKVVVFLTNKNFAAHTHLYPSHLRIDSLMMGTFLAYVYRHKQDYITRLKQYAWMAYLLAAAGISLPFVWSIDKSPEQFYMAGFGLSLLSMAFAILMVLLLENQSFSAAFDHKWTGFILKLIVKIGFYSYSIYLWHILTKEVLLLLVYSQVSYINGYLLILLYILSCVLCGIGLGKLIEIPFLKIRDQYFPKKYA